MLGRAARPQTKFSQVSAREKSISAHVPYIRHADDETLRTKEGFLVSCIKLDGFCFQTADQSEINLRLTCAQHLGARAQRQPLRALFPYHPSARFPPSYRRQFDNPILRRAQPTLYGEPVRQADVRQRSLSHHHSPGVSGQGRRDRRAAASGFESSRAAPAKTSTATRGASSRTPSPISSMRWSPMAPGC